MTKKTLKNVGIVAAITIILTSLPPVADSGILPAFDAMIKFFPDASDSIMNFIMGGAALCSVPAGILCGLIVKKVNKKSVLFITMVTFIISTAMGATIEQIWYIAIMRGISGASYGAMTTVSLGLIAELWPSDKECSRMMGLYNGIQAGGGTIMALAGGVMAASYWANPFLMFWACVPLAIMILIFIPKTSPEGEGEVDNTMEKALAPMPWLKVIAMAMAAFAIGALYCTLYLEISIYLSDLNLGDSTTAGTISAAGTIGSFLIGFIFSPIYLKFKRFTPVLYTSIIAVVFALYISPISLIVITIAWGIAGASYGMSLSYYFTHVTTFTPEHHQSLALAIINSLLNLGMAASVYLVTTIQNIFSIKTMSGTIPYLTLLFCVATVLSIILSIRDKKLKQLTQEI